MHINQLFPFLRNALGFALFWNDHFLHLYILPQNEKSCFLIAPLLPPEKATKKTKQPRNPFVSLAVYPVPLGPRYAALKVHQQLKRD